MDSNKTIAVETVTFSSYLKEIIPLIKNIVMRGLSLGKPQQNIKDEIYDVLTKKNFDYKAFDYIYESVKAVDPTLSREKYLKEFTNRKIDGKKINLFDSIDNQVTTDKIQKRIDDEFSILDSRVKRLNSYREYTGRASWDLERSIQTIKTDANYTKGLINNLKRKMRYEPNPKLKEQLRKDIDVLNREYVDARNTWQKFQKQFSSMNKMDNADPRKMIEYKKLVKLVDQDIQKRKKPFEIDRAVNATKEQVKTISKTEVQYKKQHFGIQEANDMRDSLDDNEILLVKISLNPRRSWVGYDICDEITSKVTEYGKGIYQYGKVKLPPYHPNCGCSFKLFTRKI